MSLLGLVRHLTEIERTYFRRVYAGDDVPELAFGEDPFGETPESDFGAAATLPVEVALAAWRAEADRARAVIASAASLDDPGASGLPLRFWLVKTLNEYARHNGHADILRELIDGQVGEERPDIVKSMAGFHVVWVVALAMVAYGDVVDGGCRGNVRLLGPVDDEAPASALEDRPGFDAWLDALRRWRQWSAGRAVVGGADGLGPVSLLWQHR